MLLLEEEEKRMIKGTIINKFRGDVKILEPGLKMLEDIIHIPTLGVVPYLHLDVDDEDSLSERFSRRDKAADIDIAVIRLPRISNFTDFNPLEYIDQVSVRYVAAPGQLGKPDLIILPGTKNTMDDLLWMRQNGLEAAVQKHAAAGKPILGVCGGFQMLGRAIRDPLGVEHGGEISGMGLLPLETEFAGEKTRVRAQGVLDTVGGVLSELSGQPFDGYEIHMGRTESGGDDVYPFIVTGRAGQPCQNPAGAARKDGRAWGTYIHGLFDNDEFRRQFLNGLRKQKGWDALPVTRHYRQEKEAKYDRLARIVRQSLDMKRLRQIMEEGIQ